jgi:hypothetical protein
MLYLEVGILVKKPRDLEGSCEPDCPIMRAGKTGIV